MLRLIFRLAVLALILAAAVVLFSRWRPFNFSALRETRLHSGADILGARGLDRLYTSFVLVPVLTENMGLRKRDLLKGMLPFVPEPTEKIMGGCKRTFEVAFGYDGLERLIALGKEPGGICGGALPPPAILDINGVEMQSFGRDDGACALWDQDRPLL